MVKHGLSPEEAAARFWVLDHNGLITTQVKRRFVQELPAGCSPPAVRQGGPWNMLRQSAALRSMA